MSEGCQNLLSITVVSIGVLPVETVEMQGQDRIDPQGQTNGEEQYQRERNARTPSHAALPPSTIPTLMAAPCAPHWLTSSQPITACAASTTNVTPLTKCSCPKLYKYKVKRSLMSEGTNAQASSVRTGVASANEVPRGS